MHARFTRRACAVHGMKNRGRENTGMDNHTRAPTSPANTALQGCSTVDTPSVGLASQTRFEFVTIVVAGVAR